MAQQRTLALVAVAALAACAPQPPTVAPAPPASAPIAEPPRPSAAAAPPGVVVAQPSLADYKRRLAGRIVATSSKVFHEPLPPIMKSIVVLQIRIDRRGRPLRVAVFRSNGYEALEQRAVASVIMAMPLPAPAPALLDDANSLSFLETFLFRDDGRFQVRSLVGESWKASEASR